MDTDVSLRDEPARSVAYVRRHGPYAGIPDAIAAVVLHLKRHGMAPAGPPIGVFYTDPQVVPAAEAQWEINIPLAEPAPEAAAGEDGVGIRHVEPRTFAVTVYRGPYTSVAPTYARAMRWIEAHGYTVVGPPEESYLSPPDTLEAEILTEIRIPVSMEPVAQAS